MKVCQVVLIALGALTASAADSGLIVAVGGGQVRGALLDKGGAVFKGIPFAQPPVGDLRWREPMPVKPWSGVRDATAFGPLCAQILPTAQIPDAKEDCLYLNVWTPEWPARSHMPVMVWIHGGGNYFGSGSQGAYSGESLMRHGVVVVTINYRLGVFGFLSHPELTRESPYHASGNQGILDQIAALKWVRDNIAKFGGDPGNVTIFGESSGSVDVSVLMTTPLSKGLFRRAIGESGNVVALLLYGGEPWNLQQAEKVSVEFATRLKSGGSLADLRATPAAAILQAEIPFKAPPSFQDGRPQYFPPNLFVVVDGYVFPKRPSQVFAAGQEHHIALLLGNNSRERIPGTTPPSDLKKAIEDSYGPIASRALAIYVGAADPLYGTPADQWSTDTSFRCSAVAQLTWHAAAGNPSFEFQFDRVAPGRESVGATHGSEIQYVFGTFEVPFGLGVLTPRFDATDRAVSKAMQQYWTNFAKTGNPNGSNLPQWPKFDAASRAYIEFTDAGPAVNEGLRRPFCDLFIDNVKRERVK